MSGMSSTSSPLCSDSASWYSVMLSASCSPCLMLQRKRELSLLQGVTNVLYVRPALTLCVGVHRPNSIPFESGADDREEPYLCLGGLVPNRLLHRGLGIVAVECREGNLWLRHGGRIRTMCEHGGPGPCPCESHSSSPLVMTAASVMTTHALEPQRTHITAAAVHTPWLPLGGSTLAPTRQIANSARGPHVLMCGCPLGTSNFAYSPKSKAADFSSV